MADLILTGLGVPGSVTAIIHLARFIIDRVSSYRKAPQIVENLKIWGYELCEGQMMLNIRLVQDHLLANDKIDTQIKVVVEKHIAKLEDTLREAKKIIDKSIGKDGQVDRWYFSTLGKSALQKVLRDLIGFQNNFCVFIVLALVNREIQLRKLLLTRKQFCVTKRGLGPDEKLAEHIGPKTVFARAEYKNQNMMIEELGVLIEVQDTKGRSKQDTENMLEQLSCHLYEEAGCGGILRCLGYRTDPQAELIFQLPCAPSNVTTLQRLIAHAGETESAVLKRPSVSKRLSFAVALSKAVLSVHGAKLVHKSIRPETILILQEVQGGSTIDNVTDVTSLGTPILTGWTMARVSDDPSSWRGDHDWKRNIYRHPQRQGLQVETRYHLGHDLYSLGVCLLELGLWEALFEEPFGEPARLSSRYRNTAMAMQAFAPDEVATLKRLTKPAVVAAVLAEMAKTDLVRFMGEEYSRVVSACFGRVDDVKQATRDGSNGSQVALLFDECILSPLINLQWQVLDMI